MPTRPRRRARPSAGDTRERLLASALDAFAEHGFDGTTTRDIAARAGVNLGLLQYHFGGKERLWRAAVDRGFEAFWTALEQVARDDAAPRLADLVRTAVRFAAAHPALVRLVNDEGKRDGPRLRWLVDRHGRRLYDLVGAVAGMAGKGSALAGVAPVHLYYLVVGAVGMIFSQAAECRRLTGVDPTASPALVEGHADLLVRLLGGG
jgi:AcrR family transcriptional regulator